MSAWLPVTTRPSSRATETPWAVRVTEAARDRESTSMPRRRKTSSMTLATSGPPGEDLVAGGDQGDLTAKGQMGVRSSAPVTPEPTTTSGRQLLEGVEAASR